MLQVDENSNLLSNSLKLSNWTGNQIRLILILKLAFFIWKSEPLNVQTLNFREMHSKSDHFTQTFPNYKSEITKWISVLKRKLLVVVRIVKPVRVCRFFKVSLGLQRNQILVTRSFEFEQIPRKRKCLIYEETNCALNAKACQML